MRRLRGAAGAAAADDDGDDPAARARLSSEDGEAGDRGATVAWTKLFGDDDARGHAQIELLQDLLRAWQVGHRENLSSEPPAARSPAFGGHRHGGLAHL